MRTLYDYAFRFAVHELHKIASSMMCEFLDLRMNFKEDTDTVLFRHGRRWSRTHGDCGSP